MEGALEVVHLDQLDGAVLGQLEDVVHDDEAHDGLVGQLEEVEAHEARQERRGAVHHHVVVVRLELPIARKQSTHTHTQRGKVE